MSASNPKPRAVSSIERRLRDREPVSQRDLVLASLAARPTHRRPRTQHGRPPR